MSDENDSWFKPLGLDIGSIVGGIKDTVVETVQSAATTVVDTVSSAASTVGETVKSAATAVVGEEAVAAVGDVASGVASGVADVATTAYDARNAVLSGVGDAVSSGYHGAKDLRDGAVAAVMDTEAFKAVESVTPDCIKDAASTAMRFYKGAESGVEGFVGDTVKDLDPLKKIVEGGESMYKAATDEEYRNQLVKSKLETLGTAANVVLNPFGAGQLAGDITDKTIKDYQKADAEGKGAEFLGGLYGKVGAMVGMTVATGAGISAIEGGALAGEGALARGAAMGTEATALAEAEATGAPRLRIDPSVVAETEPAAAARVRVDPSVVAETESAATAEARSAGVNPGVEPPVDPAAPLERVPRSPNDPRLTRPLGNIDNYGRQGAALRDGEGALRTIGEHEFPSAHATDLTTNPATGVSPVESDAARRQMTTLKTQADTAAIKTRGDNAALNRLRASGGNPSPQVLADVSPEAAMEREFSAAELTRDASVTVERVNLATHGQLGTLFERGTADVQAFMRNATEAEINAVIESMDRPSLDPTFAAPKGMGIPLRPEPVPAVNVRVEPQLRVPTEIPIDEPPPGSTPNPSGRLPSGAGATVPEPVEVRRRVATRVEATAEQTGEQTPGQQLRFNSEGKLIDLNVEAAEQEALRAAQEEQNAVNNLKKKRL